MLSNNHLCLGTDAQYMLLFLVLAVNSDWFRISCTYSGHLFLCALVFDSYVHIALFLDLTVQNSHNYLMQVLNSVKAREQR